MNTPYQRHRKISLRFLLYVFLLIPFFELQSITLLTEINHAWNNVHNIIAVLRVLCAGLTIFIFLLKRYRMNPLTKGIVLFELAILISSFMNRSFTLQFSITLCMVSVSFSMLCQELNYKNEKIFLRASTFLFGVLSFLGSFLIFLFPNGFNYAVQKKYAIYFLGSKNASFFYFIVYLFLKTYELKVLNKKITNRLLFSIIIFILAAIICDCVNGGLMLFLILVGLLIIKYKMPLRKMLSPKLVILYTIILAASIPLVVRGTLEPIFQLFGRSTNFSHRIFIWESALSMIRENPLFGKGQSEDLVFFGGQVQAHNFFIDIGAKYGLIALIICIGVIVFVSLRMKNSNNRELVSIGALFLLTILIHSLFDNCSMNIMIMILFCIYNIGRQRNL